MHQAKLTDSYNGRNMKKLTWIAGAAVLVLAAGGGWWWTQRAKADDVTYRTAKLERGNLQATVSASGAVNPVKQVSVGTQVSGQIKELFVDFNSEVKAGQLIAQIDPETFEYRVRSAQADLDSARAAVLTAQANIAASNAAVSRAGVDIEEAQRDLARQQSLVDKQFVAQSVADKARALVNISNEQMKSAKAQLGVTMAQIKGAQANVQQRESTLAQARIDLSRTQITSPVDGIVIKRAIEKGQTVAASLQAPELFVIAQNLSDMQVDASVDESDVGRIRNGQKASFTVDAYPGQTFEGEVRQVRKAAQNVANVVTYIAVVGFTNTVNKLLPGMTANVRLITDVRTDVLKVPNAALRVRIAGVEPANAGASAAGGASGAASGAGGAVSGAAQTGFSWMGQAFAQPAGGGAAPPVVAPSAAAKSITPNSIANSSISTSENLVKSAPKAAAQASAQTSNAVTASSISSPSASASSAPTPAAPNAAGGQGTGGGGQSGQGGGPLAEFRSRLVSELQLTADQQAKVDAIYAEARPKFAALRDMANEERGKARERISADTRAQIGDLLTPEQKPKYAALQTEMAAGRGASTRGRIYLQGADGKPVAYNVRLGITDGTSTELLIAPNSPNTDAFKEGALVIVGTSTGSGAGSAGSSGSGAGSQRPSGPRMPF